MCRTGVTRFHIAPGDDTLAITQPNLETGDGILLMKWLYIGCGAAGGIIMVGIITYRLYAHLHRIAVATSRYDVEMNVLVVLGIQVGILLVPTGVGLGLLTAAILGHIGRSFRRRRPNGGPLPQTCPGVGGSSWVTQVRNKRTEA